MVYIADKSAEFMGSFFVCLLFLARVPAGCIHTHTHSHSHTRTHSGTRTRTQQQSAVIKLNACVNNNTKQKRHLLNVHTKLLRQKVCYKKPKSTQCVRKLHARGHIAVLLFPYNSNYSVVRNKSAKM